MDEVKSDTGWLHSNPRLGIDEFMGWVLSDGGSLPRRFSRMVLVPHEGAEATGDPDMPFRAPNANNAGLSESQQRLLQDILLESLDTESPCGYALYAGYNVPGVRKHLKEAGLGYFRGRLAYFAGESKLVNCLFESVEETYGCFHQLSYLWDLEGKWCFSMPPDLDFTTVGCSSEIADRMLATPDLRATEGIQVTTGGQEADSI